MANESIRIRTTPGQSQNIRLKLEQDFDFLEILSLKISQEDLYQPFCANYGVVVGRIIANKGFGLPNAKLSIFIPITDEDQKNSLIKDLYPFKTPYQKDQNGIRYNLLLSKQTCILNKPIGTFPDKSTMLDNDIVLEVFDKYYKYTTKTNEAGDFMLFGVPTGQQVLHMDLDMSDIGAASVRPYDLISEGYPEKLFASKTEFKTSPNLDSLPQVKSGNKGIEVIPFWGDSETCEIGITRTDFDTGLEIKPTTLFFGSIFTDDGKMSLNKGCNPKNDMGEQDRLKTGAGRIEMIRAKDYSIADWVNPSLKKITPTELEDFSIDGGELIDDDGVFAFPLPMNLGHVITDEFGDLIPSPDPSIGIATKGMYRFKMNFIEPNENPKFRTAHMLLPSLGRNFGGTFGAVNQTSWGAGNQGGTEDQRFTDDITAYKNPELDFHLFEWKQIYSIAHYIKKYKKGTNRFSFLGVKNTDVIGETNLFPYTNAIWKFDLIYVIVQFFIDILAFIIRLFIIILNFCINFCVRLDFNINFVICPIILSSGFTVFHSFGVGKISIPTFRFPTIKTPTIHIIHLDIKFKLCISLCPFNAILGPLFPRLDPNCVLGSGCARGLTLKCEGANNESGSEYIICLYNCDPCPLAPGPFCGPNNNGYGHLCEYGSGDPCFQIGSQTPGCYCSPGSGCIGQFNLFFGGCFGIEIPNPLDTGACALQQLEEWQCCVKLNLAENRNVIRRNFNDAWVVGTAYLFQFKYKKNKRGKEKFCGPGSDTFRGDNYKKNNCCLDTSNSNGCDRCLLRGPGRTKSHAYFGINGYHEVDHNRAVTGANDIKDIIYCNALMSTKIVSLGRIEMCSEELEQIEDTISAGKALRQYTQTPTFFTGTYYENGWDAGYWAQILKESSYENPRDVLLYLGRNLKPACDFEELFCRPLIDGPCPSCHEYEMKSTPFFWMKEVSKVYNDVRTSVDVNGNFVFDPLNISDPIADTAAIDSIPADSNPSGNYDWGGFEVQANIGNRFSPCGNSGVCPPFNYWTTSLQPNPDDELSAQVSMFDYITSSYNRNNINSRNNIPYYYFGIHPGKTAINKLKNDFFVEK